MNQETTTLQTAPFIAVARHRLAVDGEGVTTLVAFHGCPLRCKYCLNEACLRPDGVWRTLSTQQLLEMVRVDSLYFLATRGGVTFGGGEPCLRSAFIEEFCSMMDPRWRITLETSLNVDRAHIDRLLPHVDEWIVDVKDTDPAIYEAYTGRSRTLADDNLRYLLSMPGMQARSSGIPPASWRRFWASATLSPLAAVMAGTRISQVSSPLEAVMLQGNASVGK